MKIFLSIVIIFMVGWYFLIAPYMSFSGVPWHIQGNYFVIEWEVPENTVEYRGYWSNDGDALSKYPFMCRQFKIEAPLKGKKTQRHVIRYRPEQFNYGLYYRVFAYDINGKQTAVKTSIYDIESVKRKIVDLIISEEVE